MVHFDVDPDSLVAAAEVARRQGDHVQSTAHYIGGELSRFDAFRGVLNLFRGNYEETVEHAQKGMRDSTVVADKVRSSFADCRDEYLASDRASYDLFEKAFGDQVALPAYVAPGSGESVPGGPGSAPSQPGEQGDDPAFGLKKLPPWMRTPLDEVMPGPDVTKPPPWWNPQDAAKDGLVEQLNDWRERRRYLDLREQGLTPREAFDQAKASVEDRASDHAYHQMEGRREQAYDDAYRQARGEGQSVGEARDTASRAAAAQHHGDAVEHQQREDVLGAGGTYVGAYHQVSDVINNVQAIVDHTQQLEETTGDIADYEDYEDEPADTSAQDWANR